ncbi:MAG: [acyl-carrier-protein] S-malonyltransferase [Betaproteobacteria bacterium RIFCSPLOWO2_12_FULL_62_58]|nr:MAG: [acyl-carrier-protein] S-malonyltransferase [Betaproteobacteria bacterium RIFCSPLOWO2_12_FULL_62_58]
MKFALVFPGQGSQAVGMMQPFADTEVVRETFAEASDALAQDLWQLVANGPAEELNATVNTQPVMLTAGYAVYRAWREAGGAEPALVAGHSLGEYTALVAAGVMAFREAVPLVRFRAQAMQEAVPMGAGAMAAILGLDDDTVRAACNEASQGQVVEPVNFNAPSQVVIAGHKTAVERGAEAAKARGAKRAVMLPVSAPFHSSLLKPAADRLAERMKGIAFNAPRIPVVNNVDAAMTSDPAQIKDALARQACNPVRWVEVIRCMAAAGITHVAECGPGKVLAGLTKRIDGDLQGCAITDPRSLQQTLQALQ